MSEKQSPKCRQNAATLTVEQAGKVLGLSRNAAHAAAHAGLMPGLIRVGVRQFRVSKFALAEALRAPSIEEAIEATVESVE